MKVILEAQWACTETPRGIHGYTIQIIRHLLQRNAYNYELTFFDGNRERNNRQWIDKYFGKYDIPIHECNTLSYRETFYDNDVYKEKNYNDYTGAEGDIFHFFSLCSIPNNLKGEMIVTIHDLLPFRYPDYYHPKTSEMFRLNIERLNQMQAIVITDSEAAKKDILYFSDIPEGKIHIIPLAHGMDNCFYKNNPGILTKLGIDSPYLLFLSGIAKNKNLCRIVEAFESLAERFSDIKLVVAGGPAFLTDFAAIAKVKDSPFASRIIMTGYVSDEQKHTLYSNALAFLFPSLCEGFGLPILEAMSCGCPVITSNISSMPEVAGDAAILIDPYNTEQLVHEIERVISSESLRKELRLKGLEQSKKFSWDKTAEMTEEVYKTAKTSDKRRESYVFISL
jgi:glycosyltransferase involved in cell wall biosynthesis